VSEAFYGQCVKCPTTHGGHVAGGYRTRGKAIAAWNTRPEPAADDALLAWAYDVTDRVTGAISTVISLREPEPGPYRSNIRPLYSRPTGEYERGLEDAAKVAEDYDGPGLDYGIGFELGDAARASHDIAKRIRDLKGQP
jgi:hypothetical protein